MIILLGFTPRWNVYVGSEGILLKMKFIPWKNISEKKIVARNNRKYLEIRGALSPALSRMEMKRVFLPRNVCRTQENRKRKPDSFKSLFG